MIRHWIALPLLSLLLSAASGCLHRQLLRFDTHVERDVVLMETLDYSDFWLWQENEHVFWSCVEHDDALQCTRQCGAHTDLICPERPYFQQ